jgi:type VI secretion system secreted protein Hcp
MRKFLICVGALLSSVAVQAAPGDVFLMHIPNINGDVTRNHYAGWIAVNAFSAGITTPVDSTSGSASGRPVCSPLVAIKPLDTTSPELALAAATGEHFATVTLAALAGGGQQHEFLRFTLKNAIITSIVFGGDTAASSRTETVSIIAEQVQITATPQLENGQAGTPVTTNYSCGSSASR